MSIIQALNERRAIRNYENRTVEKEKITQLLEAAITAPNDRLREPWNFYVIKDEAKHRYEKLAEEFCNSVFRRNHI